MGVNFSTFRDLPNEKFKDIDIYEFIEEKFQAQTWDKIEIFCTERNLGNRDFDRY